MKRKTTKRSEPSRIVKGHPKGAFFDLFDPDEAAELAMRAELLRGLQAWIAEAGAQTAAAKVLGVTQARVSDIKRGKIGSFSLDLLVRLAARAGLRPALSLAA
jgi:predicted XRE-type DNA-binding protein